MRNLSSALCVCVLMVITSSAQQTIPPQLQMLGDARHVQVSPNYGNLPLLFEANQGQTSPQARFVARGNGYSAFLTAGGMALSLRNGKAAQPASTTVPGSRQSSRTMLQFNLLGAARNPTAIGEAEQPTRVNYFLGKDPKRWRTNIPTYASVRYKNVYPGIDLVYYGNHQKLEYDFEVSSTGDPNLIQFEIKGANQIKLDPEGNLVLKTNAGELAFQSPIVYQKSKDQRLAVDGGYVMKDSTHISFRVARYDPNKPLVIDPTLVYSTYLGESDNTEPQAIAIDSTGAIYVAGDTDSPDLPEPALGSFAISPDAFVAKLDPTGSTLIYADYIGGSSEQEAYAITVDSTNELYVAGNTTSDDFPVVNPFQAAYSGGYTVFVAKISADGTTLLYSTYLGGNGIFDKPWGIALDSASDIFVAGETMATNFPVANAFQSTVSPNSDGLYGSYGFVTEFTPDGSSLVYSTYIGGSSNESEMCSGTPCWEPPASPIRGLAVDANGNAYFGGGTNTHDFPVTTGAYQTTLDPQQVIGGGFVGKFSPLGNLMYSTYLSGNAGGPAAVQAISVDSSGSAYVAGWAVSDGTFPITSTSICDPGVYGLACGYGFVTKLDPTGASLLYSTFLGPNNFSSPQAIALDGSNNAYILGYSFGNCASSFVTVDGIESCMGLYNVLLVEIDPTASTELFATYLGGSGEGQYAAGIAVDSGGNMYVGGETFADDFPTTEGAYQNVLNGETDGYLLKIAPDSAPGFSASPFLLQYAKQQVGSTSPAATALLRNLGSSPLSISSITVSGDFTQTNNCGNTVPAAGSCTFSVTFTPTIGGSRSGSIVIRDNAMGSPHVISLLGNSPGGVLTLSTRDIVFPAQELGTSGSAQTVRLGNSASAAVKLDSIQLSGEFAQSNNCPAMLPAASSCVINITFTPRGIGPRSGTLTILDNVQSPETVNLSGTGSDFEFRISEKNQTITAGDTATYNLTVVPLGGSFINAVMLSCSGLPAQTTCGFSPSVLTPGSSAVTATVTIATSASSTAARSPYFFDHRPFLSIWIIPLWGLSLAGILLAGRRATSRKWRLGLTMGFFGVAILAQAACAGGTGVSQSQKPPRRGTPTGTYQITVTGTAGKLQRSIPLTLIVQ